MKFNLKGYGPKGNLTKPQVMRIKEAQGDFADLPDYEAGRMANYLDKKSKTQSKWDARKNARSAKKNKYSTAKIVGTGAAIGTATCFVAGQAGFHLYNGKRNSYEE